MFSREVSLIKKQLTTFDIIFTYIGTIIGAGFASGQEINTFFCSYGIGGIVGIIIAILFFIYLSRYLIKKGYEICADSYENYFVGIKSETVKRLFDAFIVFFLMGSVTAMMSGAGAFTEQVLGFNKYIGSIFFVIIVVGLVIGGIKYIANINKIIVPFIILSTLIISYLGVKNGNNVLLLNEFDGINIKAIFSGVLYACFNIVTAISILPVLGSNAKSENSIKKATLIGGIAIGLMVFISYVAMLANYDIIMNVEIPIEVIARKVGVISSYIYSTSFLIAIFTTAVSALYGVYTRFAENKFYLLLVVILTYICSLAGFSTVVAYLYPFMGYMGIVMLGFIIWSNRRINHPSDVA